MGVVIELARAKQKIASLETELAQYRPPTPPIEAGVLEGGGLDTILREAGLENRNLGSYDYKLTTLEECRRFLKWYHDRHPYVQDGYDCNIFSLEQYAVAAKWMNGEFVWGWVWAEGVDPEWQFPNHGFNFVVVSDRKLYFCDELEVAAPRDDFIEAYKVKSNLTIA